jgi:two-component system, sensor histidine kinase and response regulator
MRPEIPPSGLSAAVNTAPLLDEPGALDRLSGSSALYATILNSFLPDLPGNPGVVRAHMERKDFAEAARALHTLKGLAATVGALHLNQCALILEREVKSGSAQTDATVEALQQAIDASLPVLLDAARRHSQA